MPNEILEKVESRGELILSRQIESYRAIQNRSGLLLGTLTIYVSFYPSIVKEFECNLRIAGLTSFLISAISIFLSLMVIRHKKLQEGLGEHMFEELVNLKYDDYMTRSISGLKTSIELNDKTLKKLNSRFNVSLIIFAIALLLGVFTIIINYMIS